MGLISEEIDLEVEFLTNLLGSIPFTAGSVLVGYFMDVYKLDYESLLRLVKQLGKLPIEPHKLFKLSIALGSLLKSSDESFLSLKFRSPPITPVLEHPPRIGLSSISEDGSPFLDSGRTSGPILPQQPAFMIKFAKDLLIILKSFNVGYSHSKSSQRLQNEADRTAQSSKNTSPIKLTSKQLLIEKLEINFDFDVLFVYQTLLQILIRVIKILQKFVPANSDTEFSSSSPIESLIPETSSIFSERSSPNTSIDSDPYSNMVKEFLTRINNGLIGPFVQLIKVGIVIENVEKELSNLVYSL